MMTNKQKESAAKELCRLRGIYPDSLVSHSAEPDANGFVPAVLMYSPAWKLALREIENQDQINSAIKVGLTRVEENNE